MIRYRSGYKYQLAADYSVEVNIFPAQDVGCDFISLDGGGTLTTRKGYAWDGPSGPTLDTTSFMRGSLAHDALYQLIRLGLLPEEMREPADAVLYRICLADGMWRLRARWVYRGVRLGAGAAATPERVKKIHEAPSLKWRTAA